ncbi:YigZ family protein [Isoptericola variabilis]|uniref:Impact N-terminal domain-containing protein n=1 Tax=Isoptericola variabilis (strain 225) TaxID=743718 RepID=F6FUF9_ISOV2|nr:YigZ family protein [Isoptericola variabilis]AEG44287.1 protein of unknown function UPF0029 [Isoptericola variabilis 225]TWH28873.1 putative YigZ family protein [Isoptericola variabilis J7]
MNPDLPSTIAAPVDHELVVRRSRFLAHLAPVRDVEEADAVVARLRKEMWDARHHCVAMVLGTHADRQRSSDDGEPSGTAGVPMLEVLRHRRVTDVVAVVTRYFGGVLLGAGGLVRAYSGAVAEALDRAQLVSRRVLTEVTLDVPHGEAGRLDHVLRDWASTHGAVLAGAQYLDVARFTVLVPPSALPRLHDDVAAASAGTLTPVPGPERVVDVPAG